MTLAKPFVKWVGGKSQLLEEISGNYPQTIKKYCEPFVGGGAVLFDILSKKHPSTVLINDINKELINTYSQIKNNCDGMISQLSEIQSIYKSHSLEENKAFFFKYLGVPAKAVGCSALRYRSSFSLRCGGVRNFVAPCSIA